MRLLDAVAVGKVGILMDSGAPEDKIVNIWCLESNLRYLAAVVFETLWLDVHM